ncbi:toprim domain-containing protein [Paenibacillus sp. AGC30]
MKLRRLRNQPGWYEIMSRCPICGHKGWCAIDSDQSVVNCMRIASDDYFDSTMGRQYKHYLDPDKRPTTKVEIMQVDSVDKKSNRHLNRVYRVMTQELPLSVFHENHLRDVRKMEEPVIRTREYRTMPVGDRYKVAKKIIHRLSDESDLLGVPGFFVNEGQYGPYWTMAGYSGLMVPFRSIYNEITGWQIRVDNPPLEIDMKGAIKGVIKKEIEKNELGKRRAQCEIEVQGKTMIVQLTEKDKKVCTSKSGQFVFSIELKQTQRYWWWSSGSKTNGSSIGGPIPYHFALPAPCMPYWQLGESPEELIDCSEVWVTEGALKADKAADGLLKPFFGLPGVGSYPLILEPLKQLGCKHVVLAFDADAVSTPEVQQALELCAAFFAENTDMKLSLALWDMSQGKGIDDLLDLGFTPQVSLMVE